MTVEELTPDSGHTTQARLLERAAHLDALDHALAEVKRTGRGRLVLIAGEAGIGKTALVQAFCAKATNVVVLAGACEPLHTARPLGPLLDIALDTRGELAAVLENDARPTTALAALLAELGKRPTILVLEDLHWADEATLDLLRLVGRRVATVPSLVLATYRDVELERRHPLRIALGELPRAQRLTLDPLTAGAVAELARPYGVDPFELHQRTGGNAFYVTEALAAGSDTTPDTVRDTVLARAARLDPGARDLLDAVAIAPPKTELWLLESMALDLLPHLEECLASGMLTAKRDSVAFRHEIARLVVEEALPPNRALVLHRAALAALRDAATPVDPARLAHHAEAAGDAEAVLRFARTAGERAACLGAHREAEAQFERALRFAAGLPDDERVVLLELHAEECYLTGAVTEGIASRREALAIHHARGDRRREGDTRRWLSRLAWHDGARREAEREGAAAIELLEGLEPGAELAMAYSNMAQLSMLAGDVAGTRTFGTKAIDLAEKLGERKILVHALNNVGTAELNGGREEGAEKLSRSLKLALESEFEDDVARAYTNLGVTSMRARDYERGDDCLARGIAYCEERDIDAYRLYMQGWHARAAFDRGRWSRAKALATHVLSDSSVALPGRVTPLIVLGLIAARRREAGAWEHLDEALALAQRAGELQRLAPVACARAEAHWLDGRSDLIAAETDEAFRLAAERGDPWSAGELAVWRKRAGVVDPIPESCAEPFRLELGGDTAAAAALWRSLGCTYDAVLASCAGDDEDELRATLDELRRLGARATADHVTRALRERGVRDIPRGPHRSTRRNPAGLTTREVEVLRLLAAGMRNANIADQLVLSSRTVEHHVSAILRKLGADTRTEAAAQATRLGLVARSA